MYRGNNQLQIHTLRLSSLSVWIWTTKYVFISIHKYILEMCSSKYILDQDRSIQVFLVFQTWPWLLLSFFFLNHHLGRFHKNFPRTKLVHNTQKLQRHRKRHPCESTPIYAAISFFSCSPVCSRQFPPTHHSKTHSDTNKLSQRTELQNYHLFWSGPRKQYKIKWWKWYTTQASVDFIYFYIISITFWWPRVVSNTWISSNAETSHKIFIFLQFTLRCTVCTPYVPLLFCPPCCSGIHVEPSTAIFIINVWYEPAAHSSFPSHPPEL